MLLAIAAAKLSVPDAYEPPSAIAPAPVTACEPALPELFPRAVEYVDDAVHDVDAILFCPDAVAPRPKAIADLPDATGYDPSAYIIFSE